MHGMPVPGDLVSVDRPSAPDTCPEDQAMPYPALTEVPGQPGETTTDDPRGLIRAMETDPKFRRDTGLGAIFHPGKLSFRELVPTASLHILIDGNRVSAHVDEISPLRCRADGSTHYSLACILAHNLTHLRGDLARRLRGLHGQQRCNLECEAVWVDDGSSVHPEAVCR